MTTTDIRHHLSDALLLAYSAGSLPEAFNLAVASHVAMCDECRARLGAFDSLGGALIERCGTAAMGPDSLGATLARIRQVAGRAAPAAHAPAARPEGAVPAPLRDYVGDSLTAVRWRPLGMGVKQAIVPTSRAATARLLYIPAGTAVPDHGHRGTELTLVLRGAFNDGADRFGPGDIEIADEAMHHTPVADIGEDCICLAVTDAPLRFKGLLPRLAQPFLRI